MTAKELAELGCGKLEIAITGDIYLCDLKPCFRNSCLEDSTCQKEVRERHLERIKEATKRTKCKRTSLQSVAPQKEYDADAGYPRTPNAISMSFHLPTIEVPKSISLNQFLEIQEPYKEV